jgi:hypothetical protein
VSSDFETAFFLRADLRLFGLSSDAKSAVVSMFSVSGAKASGALIALASDMGLSETISICGLEVFFLGVRFRGVAAAGLFEDGISVSGSTRGDGGASTSEADVSVSAESMAAESMVVCFLRADVVRRLRGFAAPAIASCGAESSRGLSSVAGSAFSCAKSAGDSSSIILLIS